MRSYVVFLLAIFTGLLYALGARLFFGLDVEWINMGGLGSGMMSFAFIFVMPFAAGFITGYVSRQKSNVLYYIFAPWVTLSLLLFFAFIFELEGLICIFIISPVFMIVASLGGLTAYFVIRSAKKYNTLVLCSVILLPFLTIPIENSLEREEKIVDVNTSIMIHADEKEVWDNIVRVYDIEEGENDNTLFLWMGFPRPIRAVLDKEDIGGVRIAEFDRGLYFTETVTHWDPMKSFTFTIEADPKSIPLTALDEHVTVGSTYFDVLEGKYELEPTPDGVLLHLSSKFKMSTSYNFYSRIWCEAIMADIQDNILHVVKKRCERN
jgi:hypothetical protein